MAHSEVGNERLAEMKKRLEQDMTDLFRDGELSPDEIRNAALEVIAQLAQKIQKLPAEREREEVWSEEPEKIMMETEGIREESAQPDAEKNGQAEALEELPELTLLVSNKERTEYDLFFVSGMEKSEVMRNMVWKEQTGQMWKLLWRLLER